MDSQDDEILQSFIALTPLASDKDMERGKAAGRGQS
jgi:hypothetical protein